MVSARALRILATARGTSLSTAFCVLECTVSCSTCLPDMGSIARTIKRISVSLAFQKIR
jgi:hypothetical protein